MVNEANSLHARNKDGDTGTPHRLHDNSINAFTSKLRRVVVVFGGTRNIDGIRHVQFQTAHALRKPGTTQYAALVAQGKIAIDLDARTVTKNEGPHNYGTKFRIRYDDLRQLYQHMGQIV